MPDRICFVYVWATCGGVERVFLSRSEALLRANPTLQIEVYFYEDFGGVPLFERYLRSRGLASRVRVSRTFDPSRYDAVFTVDTPQIITDYPAIRDKVFVECHTPYPHQRTYLQEWQSRLRTLIVPSAGFLQVIEEECPQLRGKVEVVRNFVPPLPPAGGGRTLPDWKAPVFFYFSRIDENKNFAEFVEGLAYLRSRLGLSPLGLAFGPVVPGYPLGEILAAHEMRGSVVLFPPVPFENGHMLLQLLRAKRAVFVSCSKGESFGLSAAEAMTAGVPVILSDIPPHAALAGGRREFLYPLGDTAQLAARMAAAVEHYDALSLQSVEAAQGFSEQSFLDDWQRLVGTRHAGIV